MYNKYMNRILFCLMTLLLVLTACTDESLISQEYLSNSEQVKVRFQVNIPLFKIAQTRSSAINENEVSSLCLLLFNEEGNFIQRAKATLSTTGDSFTATLTKSTKPRIIHFIANYEWPEYFDVAAIGKSEGEVVAALYTESGMKMWARHYLPKIDGANVFGTEQVELIRNMAKITVNNLTTNFTPLRYYLYNAPTRGTIAPFNTTDYTFTKETVTEPASSTNSVNSGAINPFTDSYYIYERQNKEGSTDYAFVIIEGTYDGATNYYKIDLIDVNKTRYNIVRNHHYSIQLKSVSKAGYATLAQAESGAPSNTDMEVSISNSPIISDGIGKLQVDKTLFLFTQNGSTLNASFKYFEDLLSTTFNNSGVTVELIEDDPNKPVVNGALNVNSTKGLITAAINDVPLDKTTRSARIIVRQGDLFRTIRLVLRPSFSFEPVTINGDTITALGENETALIAFTIPNDYPTELFPLKVKIKTDGLTPQQSGLGIEVEDGEVNYIYTAASPGVKTVSFVTSFNSFAETVRIDALAFVTGTAGYNVTEKRGTIYYNDDGVSKLVPHASDADLTASIGYIGIPAEDGKYVWGYPISANLSDYVLISLRKQKTPTLAEIFTNGDYKIEDLQDNATVTLNHTSNIAKGTITYGTNSDFVPLEAQLTLTSNTGTPLTLPLTLSADGVYEYTYPRNESNTGLVTISYNVITDSKMSELYSVSVPYSDLRVGNPIHLEHISNNVKGIITYGPNYSPIPQGSQISIPNFPAQFEFKILNYSDYELTYPDGAIFPPETTLYTFSFNKDNVNYEAKVTLNYLKEGKRIHLNDLTTNPQNNDVYFFGTIHYQKDGVKYVVEKGKGELTIDINPSDNLKSIIIVEDGLYKLEFNRVQSDQKKFSFIYKLDGKTYQLEVRYEELKANPNIVVK